MKTPFAFFCLGLLSAAVIGGTNAQAQPRSLFFPANRVPAANGMYLASAQSFGMSPNGIVISNLVLRGFTGNLPAPPPGTSAASTLQAQVEFDYSIGGGGTFTHVAAQAIIAVLVNARSGSGGQLTYDTEMLQLKLTGNLPALMIRESPTLPSPGQSTAGPTGGGFLISSFFDVFLEVSPDNGQTWQPLDPPQHLDLRVDPATVAEVPEPSPLWPPPDDQLVMPAQNVVTFTGGIHVKGLRQTLFSQATDASVIAINPNGLILPYIEQVDLQLSLNGGQTFTALHTSGNVTVAVQKIRESPLHIFDTEMLQLAISGNFPGGVVMIRESPTLPSFGGLTIQPFADGSFAVHSFFDVFLELSTDGGQTWRVAENGPVRLEVQGNSPRNRFASPNFPTPGGQYLSQAGMLQSYQAGAASVQIISEALSGFNSSSPPPPVGQALNQPFVGQMDLRFSLNGGLNFTSITANAVGAMQVQRSSINWGNTAFYDTEMLQLNLTGLPAGVMLRESPTLASRGRTSIKQDALGYRLDSFFDIFTELSLDGGQTWSAAAEGSVSSALHPTPIEAPLRIFCPSNITVAATSSSGAVVNYLLLSIPGDCPLGTAISSCSPPSGSVFPVGTTTVTCEAHNACGEHVSCTFLVTVTPSLPQVSDWVFARGLWPPFNSMYLSPAHFGRVTGGGVVFSNVTLRTFSRNTPPPPPGGSLTLPLELTVELDWSTDGGGLFTPGSAPARMLVSLQDNGPGSVPGQEIHNAEILSFDLTGGNLPGGLMIRESPSRPSLGQIGVRPLPLEGGFMLSSFFDIFTEVSRDGGQTWMPMDGPLHVELRVDPATLTPVPEFAPLSPPPDDQLTSPPETFVAFTGGVRVKNMRSKLFSQAFDASLLGVSGTPVMQQFDAQIHLQWSLNNGATFTSGRAAASLTVAVQKVREAASHVFDTEMLQLDITGGDLPPSVRIRESPTLPSRGQMGLEPTADGTFYQSSFFDVFLELSTDGGQTWQPSGVPLHLELQGNSLRSRFLSSKLPPLGGRYEWPAGTRLMYQFGAAGVIIAGNTIGGFTESSPPPRPGESQNQSFASHVDLQVSTDGGQTFNPYQAQAVALMRITGNGGINWGDRQFFDTEMLQLNISGGNLPNGFMLRESPTRASLGRTAMRPDGANAYRLDSFFDIFTELSLDGGQTWAAALDGSATSALFPDPTPPFAPYVITCPSNLTVYASSPSGAVVNYSLPPLVFFPDCPFCCFTATCMPPSGSLFPIGTTTVNCVGHDGCGEHPTCSFNVTVTQPFIYAGLVDSILGSAVLNTYRAGTGAPVSLVVSNLGPGGADGFHVSLGAADSAVFNLLPFPTTVQTCIVGTATGPYALDPNHVLGISTYLGGSNPIVRADFSFIGATSVVAAVRDENHHLVSSSVLANNAWLDINSLFPPGCTNPTTTVYTYWQGPDYSWWRFCRYGCNCIGTNCYTERVVCLRAIVEPAVRPRSLSGIDLRSQGVNVPSTLTILSTHIARFGNLHETIGDATFESDPGVLTINNIGSSGQDGVAVNLNRVGKFDMTLAPTRLLGAGACLDLGASGDVNGVPAVQIGSASLAGGGGTLLINGNFDALGATMARVEIYQDSELQGGITLPVGALGKLLISGNLVGCGTLSHPTPGLWARFDSTIVYVDPNNPNITGNQIRIRAANPNARVRGLTRFAVQACNIGQLGILDESVTPLIGEVSRALGGGIFITGQGVAGQMYRLEATPGLGAQTAWKTVATAEADIDGTFELGDTPSAAQQFYRTVTP